MDWNISIREHCVRRLRFKRVSGENPSRISQRARDFEATFGFDSVRMLADAQKPGSIDGYPFVAATRVGGRNGL